ncbi:MAG TPA: hypothetical protein VES67_24535 [Vicinamibacterales bacterium]|nr:hypothetical protein [Vicinamibacterales bacterium]
MSGTQFGPYRIEGLIGAGAMGEVYRARDTRLGRDVALKVLPESFAHDVDRRVRFEREARLLAAVAAHPICFSETSGPARTTSSSRRGHSNWPRT